MRISKWIFIVFCSVAYLSVAVSGSQAVDPETERTYLQATLGYYTPADGWRVYTECRSQLNQPIQYTDYAFKRLSIAKIDALAREAKTVNDLYQRYIAASNVVGVEKISADKFWKLGKDQNAIVSITEDTSAKWPTYRDNMVRFKLEHKSAQEFLQLNASERSTLLADSQTTSRSWLQATRGYYSAPDGWKTYLECRQKMRQSVDYTEHKFTHLTIQEIDALARAAKATYDYNQRYGVAMAQLELEAISKEDFCLLKGQRGLAEEAEDAASLWPEYSANLKRLGEPFSTRREFFALSSEERAKAYQLSRGSSRSGVQFISGTYSAAEGWKVYKDALKVIGIPLKYNEYEFINLDIKSIDNVTRHAVKSRSVYGKLSELCQLAGKPCPYNAIEIYKSNDLSKWDQELLARQTEWAGRVVYANSCKQVGAIPNWTVFESKTPSEQIEVAALAKTLANNFVQYAALCGKLNFSQDPEFLNLSVANQRVAISGMGDKLWEQRKETIANVATDVATAAVVIVAAIIVAKVLEDNHVAAAGRTPGLALPSQKGSQIDRDAFARQRTEFWKSEAQKSPAKYKDNPDNLDRMKAGKAPIGNDGFSMELHHKGGTPNSTLIPLTRTEHRLGDNYSRNHPWLFEKK